MVIKEYANPATTATAEEHYDRSNGVWDGQLPNADLVAQVPPAKPRERDGGCLDRQLWLTEIGHNFNHAEYRVMHYLTVVCGPKLAIPYTWAESEETISAKTGVGVRTVRRAIARAVDLGFVSIVRSGKGQYSKACSVYRLEGSQTKWRGQPALVAYSNRHSWPIATGTGGLTNPDSSSTLKENQETYPVPPTPGPESEFRESVFFSEEEGARAKNDGTPSACAETPAPTATVYVTEPEQDVPPAPAVNLGSYDQQAVADFMAAVSEYPDRLFAHKMVSRYAEHWLKPHVVNGWEKTPDQAAEWYAADPKRWRQFKTDLQAKIIRSGDIPETTDGGKLVQEALKCETCYQTTTEYQLPQVMRIRGTVTVDRCNECLTQLAHDDNCRCRACATLYPDTLAHADTCRCTACKVAQRKAERKAIHGGGSSGFCDCGAMADQCPELAAMQSVAA